MKVTGSVQSGMLGIVLLGIMTTHARAFCSYHGNMYAKTTIEQEFADSQWVVRAKVIAADNHWSDEDESWTIYRLQVLSTYKGKPRERIEMFTYQDSGGFYLDKGMSANLGGEYLLFLDQISQRDTKPIAARGALEVNYPCGQSKEWKSVSEAERRRVTMLSQETPIIHSKENK